MKFWNTLKIENMNNEKYNQVINEAYENYLKGGHIKWLNKVEVDTPIGKVNIPIPYTKKEFINKCKTDSEFSEKWGLKIEERELSLKERLNLVSTIIGEEKIRTYEDNLERVDKLNIPTKLITITYNNETIEVYE